MVLAKTNAMSLFGLSGTLIDVEVDITSQLPAFVLVGLPDASLSEATARVRGAIANSGFSFPSRKVVVNLSPAAVPKSGSSFDLAIAVGVLVAMEVIPQAVVSGFCFIGELGLDGAVKAVPGVLPMSLLARDAGLEHVVVPIQNLSEAALVGDLVSRGVASLKELVLALKGELSLPMGDSAIPGAGLGEGDELLDLSQVIGQDEAVEGLIVAAAGGHHISMIGAPGAGKTMLAERLPGILPPLTPEQAIEVAAVESIGGDGQAKLGLNLLPRIQAPHHSASMASIIGGGAGMPRPGAVSRAHHGVLFMDEALEFNGAILDALREPLESGRIVINRSAGSAVFPARFQLVLAANPCPCGFNGVQDKTCSCNFMAIRRYSSRLSGPVQDRIDIRLAIRPVRIGAQAGLGEASVTSAQARARVEAARALASSRLKRLGYRLNAEVPGPVLRKRLPAEPAAMKVLNRLVQEGKSSMRGFERCLRLAWTLADLDAIGKPTLEHVQAAVALRGNDQFGAM